MKPRRRITSRKRHLDKKYYFPCILGQCAMTAFVMQELTTEDADPYATRSEELIDLQAPPFRNVFDALSIFTSESIKYIFPDTTPKKYPIDIEMASEIVTTSIEEKMEEPIILTMLLVHSSKIMHLIYTRNGLISSKISILMTQSPILTTVNI